MLLVSFYYNCSLKFLSWNEKEAKYVNPHFSQKLRNLSFAKYIFSIFVKLSDREISTGSKVQTERWHLKINFI